MEYIDKLIKFLPFTLVPLLFKFILSHLDDRESQKIIGKFLKNWKIWDGYKSLLEWTLRQFDIFFGARNFSLISLIRCFQIAAVYPLLLLLIGWLFGGPSSIAGADLLPKNIPFFHRFLITSILIIWGLSFGFLLNKFLWKTNPFNQAINNYFLNHPRSQIFRLSIFVSIFIISGYICSLAIDLTSSASLLGSVYAMVVSFAFVGAIAYSRDSLFAFICALSASLSIFAKIFTVQLTNMASKIIVIFIFTITSQFTVTIPQSRPLKNILSSSVIFGLLFLIANMGAIIISKVSLRILPHNISHNHLLPAWIVFFLFFPFINCIFDFISWGVSRFLLKKVTSEDTSTLQIISHIIIDIISAFLFLYLLVFFMTFFIELFNNYLHFGGNYNKIDWNIYAINAVRHPWTSGIMVTLMILSTLIPTLIHFLLSCIAVVLKIFPFREKIALTLTNGINSKVQRTAVAISFTGYFIISLFFLITIISLFNTFIDNYCVDFTKTLLAVAQFSSELLNRI